MVNQYREVSRGIPGEEARKYAKGIKSMSDLAGLLQRQGDLPERFSKAPVLPEGAIRLPDLTIGGKTPKQLEEELVSGGFRVGNYARELLRSRDFTTLSDKQVLKLARVKVSDLGLAGNPTTDEIYAKAKSLGLELCPAEVGPQLRLAYKDQPLNEWFSVGMKQIADSGGNSSVFELGRRGGGSWLNGLWANPDFQWGPEDEFVFSVSPPAGEASK